MKNLIIVTSVINITKEPLSYTNVRSVFNSKERFEQTLETIKSLSYLRNKEILFIECSPLIETFEEKIKKSVDFYINLNNEPIIKDKVEGLYKGSGECSQILQGLKKVDIKNYENIIKISGRYHLNENFSESIIYNDDSLFKESHDKNSLSTVFYKINKKDFDKYFIALNKTKDTNIMIEEVFLNVFIDSYKNIDNVGVSGKISVNGIHWEI